MKLKEFQCKGCDELSTNGSAHHKLCYKCNKERLNKGKATRLKSKPKKFKRRKATGEREMFLRIWQKREHICKHCNKHLGNEPKTHYFSHIKPKSTHSHLRLEEDNIELLCMDCHRKYDHGL